MLYMRKFNLYTCTLMSIINSRIFKIINETLMNIALYRNRLSFLEELTISREKFTRFLM